MKEKTIKKVVKGGFDKDAKRDIEVVNIVVSSSLEHDIPLEKMATALSNTEYNPEQFPGLIHRMAVPKTVILLFASGRLVCTGAKKEDDVFGVQQWGNSQGIIMFQMLENRLLKSEVFIGKSKDDAIDFTENAKLYER